MLQSVALGASARLTRLFGQMTKWSCFLILQPHIKSLKPRKMSIGNHARQSFPIFWIIRHFAFKFIFARLSHGVGWIQHCDVIVFEKFRFRLQSFQKFPLWRAFSVTVFTGYVWTEGQPAQRKSCVFKRKRIRVDVALVRADTVKWQLVWTYKSTKDTINVEAPSVRAAF